MFVVFVVDVIGDVMGGVVWRVVVVCGYMVWDGVRWMC